MQTNEYGIANRYIKSHVHAWYEEENLVQIMKSSTWKRQYTKFMLSKVLDIYWWKLQSLGSVNALKFKANSKQTENLAPLGMNTEVGCVKFNRITNINNLCECALNRTVVYLMFNVECIFRQIANATLLAKHLGRQARQWMACP